ncbi:MAG TPA: glycosyltransferase [Blastocatellia bacterium]|nr:glycosyltransferase [Blastocatellia bacterium]
MRVLHVHSGNLYGGVETIMVTLARHRDLCPEMEPEFALCFEGRLSEELKSAGVSVYPLGNVKVSRPASVLRSRRALNALIKREHFDAVVCHSAWTQAIFGPVARGARLPLVFWLHNRARGRHWTERWARMTEPDLILCVSRDTAKTSSNIYPRVELEKEVFYSPVDLPKSNFTDGDRAAVRAELGAQEDATVIIQVSRMEPWKGHHLHLEALARLRDLPDWVCWQVGGAERPEEVAYFEELKQAAARLGIADRVRFLGRRSDVPRLLAASDIFCQPNNDTEGFSIAFVEAFYARLPIVTSAIGGALEVVDDTCGFLLPVNDADALAGSLRVLVSDRSLRERLGASGHEKVIKLCDPAAQINKLNKIFTGVVTQKA